MRIPDIDFPPVSSDEWKEKIIKDLRGKPFEDLIRKNKEGIEVKPAYHSDTSIPGSTWVAKPEVHAEVRVTS
jgi:hypothetical protein